MDLWLSAIAAVIVILVAGSLYAAPSRSERPGRGWDYLTPRQKAVLAFTVLLLLAFIGSRM